MTDKFQALRQAIHGALTSDLLSPAYRGGWSEGNPTFGHCAVASEAAWFLLGGKPAGWTAVVARDGEAGTHWWLENRHTGERFDPTREQYDQAGHTPPYERGMPGQGAGFMGIRKDEEGLWDLGYRPSRRAQVVLGRMMEQRDCENLTELSKMLAPAERAHALPRPYLR